MASGSVGVVIKALGANLGIAAAKFVVAFITGSAAMLAEAVHSFADSGNQVLLLVGMKRAAKSEDAQHEFGYGKAAYFWAFIVAISLFTMGATFSIYEGVHKLANLDEARFGNVVWAYVVLGVSIALESFSMHAAYTEFQHFRAGRPLVQALRESRDAALVVVLFEDGAALTGLLLALAGVTLTHVTGSAVYDGLASIGVGLVLGGVATFVAMKSASLLVGESVTAIDREKIVAITTRAAGVRKLIHLRTMHLGPSDVIVAMKIAFDDDTPARQVSDYVNELEDQLRAAVPILSRIYVEIGTIAEPPRSAHN